MGLRGHLRRIGLGLSTLFGPRPRGHFIPHRRADEVRAEGYPEIEKILATAAPSMCDWLAATAPYRTAFDRLGTEAPPAPRWDQDWFPRLDAAMAYTFVRRLRPARIVEIGSGHSTRFLARAVRDGGIEAEIIAVDPEPRASIRSLTNVKWLEQTVQAAKGDVVGAVRAADMLLVDSSHVLMPGTDVDLILTELLPQMARGAYVHFHDIFLPDAYPEAWRWRNYNEQSAIAVLLTSPGWQVEFASYYARARLHEAISASAIAALPLLPGAFEAGLWLRKM